MMNGSESLYSELPVVKRTRDYHVYDNRGVRYFDMWLDSGRALMGHKTPNSTKIMKNLLEQGLSAAYPTVHTARLEKAVKNLYPGVREIAAGYFSLPSVFPLVRPFEQVSSVESFEILIPLAAAAGIRLAASYAELPPGINNGPVPAFLAGSMARSFYDLASFSSRINQNVWQAFDCGLWERKGPWLYPAVSEEVYPELFRAMLKRRIIISPYYNIPSCAPVNFTDGEIKPIKEIVKDFT